MHTLVVIPLPELVCLESDVLWGAVPTTAEDGYRSYWGTWLRLASAIGQSGRPVALFGTTLPAHLEAAPYRKKRPTSWVGYKVHLTETCDDDRPHLITQLDYTYRNDERAARRWRSDRLYS